MLFILSEQDDLLGYVPSEYNICVLSSTPISNKKGYNFTDVPELLPSREVARCKEKKKAKDMYRDELNNKKYAIALLVYNAMKSPLDSYVLYVPTKELDKYPFKFTKILRKYIEERYDMKLLPFTNCLTRSLREKGKMSDHGISRLENDIRSLE